MRRRLRLRSDSLVPRFAHGVLATLLVAVTASSAGAGVEIGLNFTGYAPEPGSFGALYPPPDTMGAVGEQHIVEFLNHAYSVYRKSDGQLLQRVDELTNGSSGLTKFWEAAGVTPTGGVFDPRVLYDAASQRWFAVSLDYGTEVPFPPGAYGPNNYLVAVSKSADPTEGWTGFKIASDPTGTTWADFPQMGMDAEALYLGGLRITLGGGNAGQNLLVLPKADLLAAIPSVANATNLSNLTLNQTGINPQPVVNLDGGGLPATLLSGVYASLGALVSTEIGGSIESPVLARSKFIAVPATEGGTVPYSAAQPGPKTNINAGPGRFSAYAMQVNGSIWAAESTRVDGRLAVRWYEIDAATDTLSQSGDVTQPTLDLYYPSIAVNPYGQVVIGMSGSSETDFVGAYAAVGETVGGVTSFGAPLLLQAGLANFERVEPEAGRNTWGDYSATVVDPSDPHRFWTFQEYVEAEDIYAVRITELILTPEPGKDLLGMSSFLGLAALRRRRE